MAASAVTSVYVTSEVNIVDTGKGAWGALFLHAISKLILAWFKPVSVNSFILQLVELLIYFFLFYLGNIYYFEYSAWSPFPLEFGEPAFVQIIIQNTHKENNCAIKKTNNLLLFFFYEQYFCLSLPLTWKWPFSIKFGVWKHFCDRCTNIHCTTLSVCHNGSKNHNAELSYNVDKGCCPIVLPT